MPIKFRTGVGYTTTSAVKSTLKTATLTKTVTATTTSSVSSKDNTPVREWNVNPVYKNIIYNKNDGFPENELVTVTFPDLEKIKGSGNYSSYFYKMELGNNQEFVEIISEQTDFNQLKLSTAGKVFFEVKFKNLDSLPTHYTPIEIFYKVYGSDGQTETLLETKKTEFNLIRNSNDDRITVDKKVYNVVYNKNDETLFGDLNISIIGNPTGVSLVPDEDDAIMSVQISGTDEPNVYALQKTEDINDVLPKSGMSSVYRFKVVKDGFVYDFFDVKVTAIGLDNDLIDTNYSIAYNFALDPVYFQIKKSKPEVDRVVMNLKLLFWYDNEVFEVDESYEYVFLNETLKVYPGEEIHDFFKRLQPNWLKNTRIEELKGLKIIQPRNLFKMCVADIEFVEYDSKWNEQKRHSINNVKWIPGKRPKSFPYLTNSKLRRTYSDSLITVCALQQDFVSRKLSKIASPLVDMTKIKESDWIVQSIFDRKVVDSNYGEDEIVTYHNLSLEPFPNPDMVVHVIFENQNLCPDWFSFAEVYEIESELDHTMTHNLKNNSVFKANVTETEKLILNTGWILEEEIEVLKELIKGGLCFVKLPNRNWIKAIPIEKKPLKYNSNRKLHKQTVEFEIINNDR